MKKSSKSSDADATLSAADQITNRIAELGDWRGETLARMRKLIKDADPDVVETWKWMGTPIWEHDGIICTGESYKKVVKLTFAKGASLNDPSGLFNSSLEGSTRRAIDIAEGEVVDAAAFKALVREAIALNSSGKKKPAAKSTQPAARTAAKQGAKTVAKEATSKKTPVKKSPAKKSTAAKSATRKARG